MNVTGSGLDWLSQHQPLLLTSAGSSRISGVLGVSAYYDRTARKVVTGERPEIGSRDTFLADQFTIVIDLEDREMDGWPKVYEVSMRHNFVARRYRLHVSDLHFYPDDSACLGLPYPGDPPLTIESFVSTLVEPFFYRLSYVDLYGIAAARGDLWPEYSHGSKGLREHREDVRRMLSRRRR